MKTKTQGLSFHFLCSQLTHLIHWGLLVAVFVFSISAAQHPRIFGPLMQQSDKAASYWEKPKMNTTLEIRQVKVKDIHAAEYNPRYMSEADLKKLKTSMETFGYVDPLVWNETSGNLVGGHMRLKILIEQGVEEVAVSVVRLSLPHEKALNLALNKIQGEFVEESLSKVLSDLSQTLDFDVTLTGFDVPEIDKIINKPSGDDDFDTDAVAESITEPITQKGDIIDLGNGSRILCGDTSNLVDVERLMGGEKANLVLLDPPYNCQYYGGNRPHADGRPKPCKHWQRIYADNMPQGEYETWLTKVFSNVSSILAPGAALYCWNGHKQFAPMHKILIELSFHISCVITWAKPNFAISYGDYNQQTEFCLYSWKEANGAHKWYGPNNESTLWEANRDPSNQLQHATQKPISLAQRAIKNSSQKDELIFEGFLGSGSSLIAATSLNRRCFGIEIDPRYCDAIVGRYIAFVGENNVSQALKDKYLINKIPHGLPQLELPQGGNNEQ